jgi:nucleoside phosphorylase
MDSLCGAITSRPVAPTPGAARAFIRDAAIALLLLLGVARPAPATGSGALALSTPADPLCAVRVGACAPGPYVAVLSAFPAELEPLLAATQVTETVALGERTAYVGILAGARVVLVRSGIGFVNATTTAIEILDRFPIAAFVFSGVAGSRLDIGDVAVPAEWTDGTDVFPVAPPLLDIAATLASPPVALEQCTPVPPDPPGAIVCLHRSPRIVVGGRGESGDPFDGRPFPCTPGAGPVFGCAPSIIGPALTPEASAAEAIGPDATDMESAAVARVALDAGIPFIAVRGVSDGGGDPLGLPGFPAQFFAYYRLAANNAAAVTMALLEAWSRTERNIAARPPGERPGPPRPRIAAACAWARAADPVCGDSRVPGDATRRVARACRLEARAASTETAPTQAERAAQRARKEWRKAEMRIESRAGRGLAPDCRVALATALTEREIAPRVGDSR